MIELIRQFYELPRCFRILGQSGAEEFVRYSNAGLAAQPQGTEFGVELGYRLPLFDIAVTAQKASPYSKLSQNELALQFFTAGMFDPRAAEQALACLDMMDFDRKEFVMQRIAANAESYRQQQLSLLTQAQGAQGGEAEETTEPAGAGLSAESAERLTALGGSGKERPAIKKAKQRVANSTAP